MPYGLRNSFSSSMRERIRRNRSRFTRAENASVRHTQVAEPGGECSRAVPASAACVHADIAVSSRYAFALPRLDHGGGAERQQSDHRAHLQRVALPSGRRSTS